MTDTQKKQFKQTTFILNPRSGPLGGRRSTIRAIDRVWGSASKNYKILVTSRAGEATRLAEDEAERGSDLIVAVGGDGTLNEVVKGVLERDVSIGLLPAGSGNGFARHWKIPLNVERACRGLLNPRIISCDVGIADEHLFLVTFGCGLDADISDRYARSTIRGMGSYIYHVLKAYFGYSSDEITVLEDGQIKYESKPLILTVCNTSGYGGGIIIAPDAALDDGLLDLCIIPPLSLKTTLTNLPKLFNGEINSVPGYRHMQVKEVLIKRKAASPIHVDGDPFSAGLEIHVKVKHRALRFALPA
ncbi:hypothetical protein CEE37_06415 [candidate division LCP-89 bacterium B3_LCP]|uniref:DAGKc domain-containing protein n=1 Tax=candidate division LCP-89 bacterium B3_LCP TaxID=2012998 RepID=A0A532V280_UNCL8|nr:MAG: hypothetical protein CEE37_06415 [candidate division LCP-89 bacterium B3_LCP]